MNLETTLLSLFVAAIIGASIGYVMRWLITLGKEGSVDLQVKKKLLDAKEGAQKIIERSKEKATQILDEARKEDKKLEVDRRKADDRHIKKDDLLDKRQTDIDREDLILKKKMDEVRNLKGRAEAKIAEAEVEINRISKLTTEEAKDELFDIIKEHHEKDIVIRVRKMEINGRERLDRLAKDILSTSIQRLANSTASDVMSMSVPIPNDDIKGKIIGKEGRNIRTFEREAGVELVVDDTPGTVLISSFDPVRRQVARVALENLILDGRIQPAKIEDTVAKAKDEINKIIKDKGEKAAFECGVFNLDPRIISILGRLYFRTSYGQNVLQHSIEMAHISGMIAEELGADVAIAKTGALLHDIGKAITHEVQGTHVEIGRRILQKFGADEKIILAMQAHHEEYPYETIESIIVQTADAISGGRPGARRDSVENYLKRLEELEGIATSFNGVEKAYALQAGREIRIFVEPEKINDLEAREMARNIAVRVESELNYPGEIKVNVIRESRSIEFAR